MRMAASASLDILRALDIDGNVNAACMGSNQHRRARNVAHAHRGGIARHHQQASDNRDLAHARMFCAGADGASRRHLLRLRRATRASARARALSCARIAFARSFARTIKRARIIIFARRTPLCILLHALDAPRFARSAPQARAYALSTRASFARFQVAKYRQVCVCHHRWFGRFVAQTLIRSFANISGRASNHGLRTNARVGVSFNRGRVLRGPCGRSILHRKRFAFASARTRWRFAAHHAFCALFVRAFLCSCGAAYLALRCRAHRRCIVFCATSCDRAHASPRPAAARISCAYRASRAAHAAPSCAHLFASASHAA